VRPRKVSALKVTNIKSQKSKIPRDYLTPQFVEHYQKYQVIWNGENGRTIMFLSETPYDPPNQAAWSHDGVAAYKVQVDNLHSPIKACASL
jgi:hypothetical protein